MIRYWLEKPRVQDAILLGLLAIVIYYFGWVFDFGYKFDWSVLFVENETYKEVLGLNILKGLWMSVKITAISSAIGLGLGTVLALSRLSDFKPLQLTATVIVEFFRNTPLLVVLFFFYFALPMAVPESVREWLFELNFEFWTASVAVGMYTSSFMAEVIRAGLQSIPKGLLEAAYSSGLNYFQVLTRIILPLAFREIIPPLGSEFLNNMKNTSLAMFVGVADLTWQGQQIGSLTFKQFEATTAASLIYLCLSLLISFVLNGVNGKIRGEAGKKGSIPVLFITGLIVPFTIIRRMLFSPVAKMHREHRRKRAAASAQYSQGTALLMTVLKRGKQAIVICCKIAFLAVLAGALLKAVSGLLSFDWNVIFQNLRQLLIWQFPSTSSDEEYMGLGGFSYSLIIAVLAVGASSVIGLLVGLGRTSEHRVFRLPSLLYIELIRGNPLIIVIYWVYFFIPVLFNTTLPPLWSATAALTFFTGAYLAEIVRSGIQNIPGGQVEAGYSSGLSYWQVMRKIILPQALKQMIPPIVGLFIAIFKDTSLVSVLNVMELTTVTKAIDNRLMVNSMEMWTTAAVLYFVPCYLMSVYANRLERRLSPERVNLKM